MLTRKLKCSTKKYEFRVKFSTPRRENNRYVNCRVTIMEFGTKVNRNRLSVLNIYPIKVHIVMLRDITGLPRILPWDEGGAIALNFASM